MKFSSFLVTCLLILILLCVVVLAENHEGEAVNYGADYVDSTVYEIDWSDQQNFDSNFYADPAAGFQNNPDQAWTSLNSNPDLFATDSEMMTSAFANDPSKAAAFLNANPNMFKSKYDGSDGAVVVNENYLEIRSSFTDAAKDDISLLNDNSEARVAWLSSTYYIEDSGSGVLAFDGEKLTTAGTGSTIITLEGFPDAKIQEDGSVVINRNYNEEGELVGGLTITGGSLNFNEDTYISEISGNAVVVGGENSEVLGLKFISSEGGESPTFIMRTEQGDVVYSGDFEVEYQDGSYEPNVAGYKISSVDGKPFTRSYDSEFVGRNGEQALYPSYAIITGDIIDPIGSREDEFVVGSDTRVDLGGKIKDNRKLVPVDYGTFSNDGGYLYYSENPYSNAKDFCVDSIACMVNSPNILAGVTPAYRTELYVANVVESQKITFESIGITNSIQLDSIGGFFKYVEIEMDYDDLDRLTVVKRTELDVTQGEVSVAGSLSQVGKVDVYSRSPNGCEVDCSTLRQHWSSTLLSGTEAVFYQSNSQYFGGAREAAGYEEGFVSCVEGVDCTQIMASSFGKVVIGSDGSDPKTIIIVGGDWPDTALDLEKVYCKEQGCYIVHSRDVADELPDSIENVVITGHHYGGEARVFNLIAGDTTCFGQTSSLACSSTLPQGSGVETVTLSSCSSVTAPRDGKVKTGFEEIVDTYPNVETVAGWNGIGRALDINWKGVPPGYVEPAINYYGKDIVASSSFAQYQKNDDGEWGYSTYLGEFKKFEGPTIIKEDVVLEISGESENLASGDAVVDSSIIN